MLGLLPMIRKKCLQIVRLLVDTSYSSANRCTDKSSPRKPRNNISKTRSRLVFSTMYTSVNTKIISRTADRCLSKENIIGIF